MRREYSHKRLLRRYVKPKRLRFIKERAGSIVAISILLIAFMTIIALFSTGSDKKGRIPPENVFALRVPIGGIEAIYDLSKKYGIDFIDLFSVYCIDNKFFPEKNAGKVILSDLEKNYILNYETLKNKYLVAEYQPYFELTSSIFTDIKNFPTAVEFTSKDYMFGDSYGASRDYGGDREHNGTDLFDRENIKGRIGIISMVDGTIQTIGWSELGGYNIGISTANGNYYYYAHLDSFEPGLSEGSIITAGQKLGNMGDTGYSKKEGTSGNFPVHVHIGIAPAGQLADSVKEDIWINPYPILKYLEEKKQAGN